MPGKGEQLVNGRSGAGTRSAGQRGEKPPRIRHLTSAHAPDDSRILHRECASLAAVGHDVGVIVGCAPRGPVDGVPVTGVGAPHNRRDRVSRVAWNVFRAARRERADICQFHDPELLWVGLLLKAFGHRVVYDVHEDVPKQIMNKAWIPRAARRLLAVVTGLVEHVGAACFDAIVAATPSIGERFPPEKTVVVQNFPGVALARTDDADGAGEAFEQRPYAFAYIGGLTEVQGVREIVSTSEVLGADQRGVLAGWFDEPEVEQEVRQAPGWQGIDYRGELSHAEAVATMRRARTGLVVDRPIINYLDSYSTKMFEYMACGLPVICSDFPLWVDLVGGAECGVTVDPRDPAAIAATVARLAADPDEARRLGENGRKAVLERYNWENEFAKLDDLYRRLV